MKAENVTVLKTNLAGPKSAGIFAYGRFSHDVPIKSDICIICCSEGYNLQIMTNNTPNERILICFSFFINVHANHLIYIMLICININFSLKTEHFHCIYLLIFVHD